MPDPLSYPDVLTLEQVPEIVGQYVYVIDYYELNGMSILAFIDNGVVKFKFSDWDGKILEFNKDIEWLLNNYADKIGKFVEVSNVKMLQLYFSDKMLVDVRTSINHFIGPGMIKDVFGQMLKTQVIRHSPLIYTGQDFGSKFILKPSLFKTIIRGNNVLPMYAIGG